MLNAYELDGVRGVGLEDGEDDDRREETADDRGPRSFSSVASLCCSRDVAAVCVDRGESLKRHSQECDEEEELPEVPERGEVEPDTDTKFAELRVQSGASQTGESAEPDVNGPASRGDRSIIWRFPPHHRYNSSRTRPCCHPAASSVPSARRLQSGDASRSVNSSLGAPAHEEGSAARTQMLLLTETPRRSEVRLLPHVCHILPLSCCLKNVSNTCSKTPAVLLHSRHPSWQLGASEPLCLVLCLTGLDNFSTRSVGRVPVLRFR